MSITVSCLLRASALNALEARILLADVLKWSRTELITRAHQILDEASVAAFLALEERRLKGEPVAQLIGQREFFGLTFRVNPAVLIPRPETEFLVEQALEVIQSLPHPTVLDLGTGSGAIAISIKHQRPDANVTATDRCRQALAVAAWNARRLLPSRQPYTRALNLLEGCWYDALSKTAATERFDLIVSNPPYIAANDLHLSQGDLRFEPLDALTDHADGLAAVRKIVHEAPTWLKAGGALWIEHGYDQAQRVRDYLNQCGFKKVHSVCDLAGIERISGGII